MEPTSNNSEQSLSDQVKQLTEQLERVKKQSAGKTAFLYSLSHEVRTPMTAIIGFTDLLIKSLESESVPHRYAQRVKSNCLKLLSVFDDMLDLSRVQSGKLKVEVRTFDLNSLMEQKAAYFVEEAKSRDIEFSYHFEKPLSTEFRSDPIRVEKIVSNLIMNALKFTDAGTVSIRASMEQDYFQMEITDSGIGIDPELIQSVFEPFVQVKDQNDQFRGGLGIGLSLTKSYVEALKGEMQIIPSETKGTVVRVKIKDQNPQNEDTEIGLHIHGRRVLVVDDSDDSCAVFEYYLRTVGAEVSIARSGRDAIEQVMDHKFDTILMDISLPDKDGFAVTTHLRDNGFLGQVIALTAHDLDVDGSEFIKAKFNGYLTKPLDRQEFLRALNQILSAASA